LNKILPGPLVGSLVWHFLALAQKVAEANNLRRTKHTLM
jgi:hypothetical protein